MMLKPSVKGALLGCLLHLPSLSNAQSKRAWELSDVPSPEIFLRRAEARGSGYHTLSNRIQLILAV